MKTLLLSLILLSPFTQAHKIDDIEIPNLIPATDQRPELKLNGAALRELYLLIKSYVGSLYLEHPNHSAEAILNDTRSHKRMVFHVRMKRVGARRIASALQDALIVNLSDAQHEALKDNLAQMLNFFDGKMHRGDEAIFDFIPNVGTRISINDEVKGIIPGDLYFQSMMTIWIGEHPVGRDFKKSILGLGDNPPKYTQFATSN